LALVLNSGDSFERSNFSRSTGRTVAETRAEARLSCIMTSAIAVFVTALPALLAASPGLGVPSAQRAPATVQTPPVSVENRAVASQPGNTLTLEVGAQTTFTAVDRNRVQSRAIDLQRTGDHLHGFVADEESDLQIDRTRIFGRVGTRPVALEIARAGGGLDVRGVFGGRTIALELDTNLIQGDAGPCHYLLKNRRGDYVGTADCGGAPTPVRLQLPVALVLRGDAELAAVLIALLAS
jgi:hypothetical protein